MPDSRIFAGREYLDALKKNYPTLLRDDVNLFGFVRAWNKAGDQLGAEDRADRFTSLRSRPFRVQRNAWAMARGGDVQWAAACRTYKGLINLKSPFDLVLYASLIWELQPRTIIEFGSLQGGSALWFADQLDSLCGQGEVHTFEILDQCIHSRAQHPRLHFHHINLDKIETLNTDFLATLPRPWLVIDDAHANVEAVIPVIASLLQPGDYYVWEDITNSTWATAEHLMWAVQTAETYNLRVDTKYTDAFGMNVTCSPNAWFRKF